MGGPLGATLRVRGGCRFGLWAPFAKAVDVEILGKRPRAVRLTPDEHGYHTLEVDGVAAGARYFYRLDGGEGRADPSSRSQPDGVHGPSEVVDLSRFPWTDRSWKGHRLEDLVIYELHVGTYTPEGTFKAIIPHLRGLAALGVTAIELMPVAQFSGSRNWGYDGVFLFAPQHSYGGPEGLQKLVNAAHRAGLAVLLDVVYNHIGPEGNHFHEFGPYFNKKHATPWGEAINVDGRDSDHVRRFLLENAFLWLRDYHLDGLRLDAVHAIVDYSAKTFMEELAEATHRAAKKRGSPFHVIAESSANDPRYVRPPEENGWGLDAMWSDDFSHALYTFTTKDRSDYNGDYRTFEGLAKAFRNAFVFDGNYSRYRKRRHGRPPLGVPGKRFVVCADNHDRAGNRVDGSRLSNLVSFENLKLSAAAVILSPFVPLLFMGEEYAEPAPFLFFTDHSDPALRDTVTRGRREEFTEHGWSKEPPDHSNLETFERSKLGHGLKTNGAHARMLAYYGHLLQLRRKHAVLRRLDRTMTDAVASEDESLVTVVRRHEKRRTALILHSGKDTRRAKIALPRAAWKLLVDSSALEWGGPGKGHASRIRSTGSTSVEIAGETALLYESGGAR